MWLYTHKGFLSIVQDFRDENQVVVRGKFREDIDAYFPGATVEIDTGIDYKYRTYLPKEVVADCLKSHLMNELSVRQSMRTAAAKKIS
jgi:hypothetical protein